MVRQGLAFEPFREGIQIHRLYGDGREGPAASLHQHTSYEHILMLDGSQEDERGTFGPGAFVVNPPGSRHSVRSLEGCVALLIWERPVRFIDGGD